MPTVKVDGISHWVLTENCALCGCQEANHFVEDGYLCDDCNDYHNGFFCDECVEYACDYIGGLR